jgi:copper oxidase (laccase) domain-containing protein
VQRITYKLVEAMTNAYGCSPADMQAAICPSAGPCCYEVKDDVRSAATNALGDGAADFFVHRDEKMFLDLWRANTAQLVEAGLCGHNVQAAGVCTICDQRFFSYRREAAQAGRFGGLIARV